MRRSLISLLVALTLAACGGAPPGTANGEGTPEMTPPLSTGAPTPEVTPPPETGAGTPEVTPSQSNGVETPEMTPPSDTGAATTEAPLSSKIAVLTRSGGIMGLHEVLTVQADGRLVLEREGQVMTGQAETASVEALENRINSPAWNALAPKYGRQFPDAFAYTIEAGGKSVTTYDGAQNPEPLASVLQHLLDLLQATGAGGSES